MKIKKTRLKKTLDNVYKDFAVDYDKLIGEAMLFRIKWGLPVNIVIGKTNKKKGRELGKLSTKE